MTTPGDAELAQWFEQLYQELRRLARARLRAQSPLTLLDTTALVHESFMRLVQAGGVAAPDRERFLAYAAKTMRSIIVDGLRRRHADKRGAGIERTTLDTELADQLGDDAAAQVLRIDDALRALEAADPRAVQVVEMRYFAGMTDDEIATILGVTDRTVRRDWERARLLLQTLLA